MSAIPQQARLHKERHLSFLDFQNYPEQTVEKILRYGAPVGAALEHHTQLDRCMDRLQQLMTEAEHRGETLDAGTVVIADRLIKSSGRFERHWHAPDGGVWLSMAWPDTLLPEFTRLLPFAVGLACCRVIRSFQMDARLKWVNDVPVAGKKIGGILCETVQRLNGERYHLLGIGLNVNNRVFPDGLQTSATSIACEAGHDVELAEVIGRLLAELTWSLGLLYYDEELSLREQQGCEQARRSLVLTGWQQLCDSIDRRVEYGFDVQETPLYRAVISGIDPCGGLIMRLGDGSIITEYSGEIRYLSS